MQILKNGLEFIKQLTTKSINISLGIDLLQMWNKTITFCIFFLLFLTVPQIHRIDVIKDEPRKYSMDSQITLLSANVGNLDLRCRNVLNNLCYKDVEQRIADSIKELDPDIVTLQEVLAPWQCENYVEKNPKKICYNKQEIPQARRLLGSNYTIVCDDRNHFECTAVKVDFGHIQGCPAGSYCTSGRTNESINGCDNGFSISSVTVISNKLDIEFDIVNAHPQSTNSECRAKMISQIFNYENPEKSLVQKERVILMGDFNLDPWRDSDQSIVEWNKLMSTGWSGRQLRYHSGIIEKNPPYPTSFLLWRRKTVDFIVSNFATEGGCAVLGLSPGTIRLDGGKGTDHRAIYGSIKIID